MKKNFINPLFILFVFFALQFKANAQTVSFSVSADTLCQDSCIRLINTSTGPADSIRWVVYGDTSTVPRTDTVTVCFLSAGLDSVRLYVYHSGSADSATRLVHINPTPHPKNLYLGPNECCEVVDAYQSYQWYESEGPTLIPGATSHMYSAGMGGWYVVVDSGGCPGKSNILLVSEGVAKISAVADDLQLFPNPAINTLALKGSTVITSIAVSNLMGQALLNKNYDAKQVQINVADLPPGLYLVKVNGSEVRRFVKQ